MDPAVSGARHPRGGARASSAGPMALSASRKYSARQPGSGAGESGSGMRAGRQPGLALRQHQDAPGCPAPQLAVSASAAPAALEHDHHPEGRGHPAAGTGRAAPPTAGPDGRAPAGRRRLHRPRRMRGDRGAPSRRRRHGRPTMLPGRSRPATTVHRRTRPRHAVATRERGQIAATGIPQPDARQAALHRPPRHPGAAADLPT